MDPNLQLGEMMHKSIYKQIDSHSTAIINMLMQRIPYSSRSIAANKIVFFLFIPFLFISDNCLATSNMATTPEPLSSTPTKSTSEIFVKKT